MKSDYYMKIMEFYRKAWKLKRSLCFEIEDHETYPDCDLMHKCKWFHSPLEKDNYVQKGNIWSVLLETSDSKIRCCPLIPHYDIVELRNLIGECERLYES